MSNVYLGNKFDFWNVHGIMNASGLLLLWGFTLTLSGTASVNTDSQWIKQEACFPCATPVQLAVNHTPVSLLANGFNVYSKHIERASELGSYQSK